jgi:hypothetical protein
LIVNQVLDLTFAAGIKINRRLCCQTVWGSYPEPQPREAPKAVSPIGQGSPVSPNGGPAQQGEMNAPAIDHIDGFCSVRVVVSSGYRAEVPFSRSCGSEVI